MNTEKSGTQLATLVMTDKVPLVSPTSTVEEIEKLLDTEKPDQYDSINYIYIVNEEKFLLGIVSIKEVFRNKSTTVLSTIMNTDLITIKQHSHQERAAFLAVKNNIKAVPVIDKEGKLLGVITSDTIFNILHRAHVEDLLYSTGIGSLRDYKTGLITAPVIDHLKARLPWLIVGLAGGMLAASIVSGFEVVIRQMILLAAFLPAVVYMGAAVGMQSQMILVSSMVIEKDIKLIRYIWRELGISSSIGIIIGVSAGLISQIFWRNSTLSLIVSTAFIFTITVSALIGVVLPLIFKKFKIDPSVGSGPIATVTCDIVNILIYFAIATFFLRAI